MKRILIVDSAELLTPENVAAKGKNTWTKGMHWYNDGKVNKFCYECPDGFTPGRLH